jgi:hypothetical protein
MLKRNISQNEYSVLAKETSNVMEKKLKVHREYNK